MTALCVQDHGEEGRRAADGIRLCTACRRRLETLIRALPERYAQLEDCLTAGSTAGSGDRVSGSSSTPLPINPAAAGCRYDIQHGLVSWTVYVVEARGLTALPSGDHPGLTAPWLARQCDWLSADPVAAEECLPTMRALTGSAWSLIDPSGRQRIKVGPCTQVGEEGPCTGVLYATVRQEDDPRPSAIVCDRCDFELAPQSWLRFGRTYQRQMTA